MFIDMSFVYYRQTLREVSITGLLFYCLNFIDLLIQKKY